MSFDVILRKNYYKTLSLTKRKKVCVTGCNVQQCYFEWEFVFAKLSKFNFVIVLLFVV